MIYHQLNRNETYTLNFRNLISYRDQLIVNASQPV